MQSRGAATALFPLPEPHLGPGPLLRIPPRWRDIPPGHDRIPYGQLKKNWRQWEKERRWDKARHEMKREMKEERREHKQEHRKDHPGQGRGRHDD